VIHHLKFTSWSISSSETPQEDVTLDEELRKLLEVVEPVGEHLKELHTRGCEITWSCFLEATPIEGMNVIERETLQRLVALPGDLLLDVYGVDDSDDDSPPNPDSASSKPRKDPPLGDH